MVEERTRKPGQFNGIVVIFVLYIALLVNRIYYLRMEEISASYLIDFVFSIYWLNKDEENKILAPGMFTYFLAEERRNQQRT